MSLRWHGWDCSFMGMVSIEWCRVGSYTQNLYQRWLVGLSIVGLELDMYKFDSERVGL